MICGYSEAQEKLLEQKAIDEVTISKNVYINKLYFKFFGNTNKRIVKKLLKYLGVMLFLAWIFYHFFLYIDIPNNCFITIRPALLELSNTSIKKGIRYLKSNYFSEYIKFCNNVSSVDPNISCGGFGGGCYSEYKRNPGLIDISTPYGSWQSAAKVIIHETCHAIQFNERRPFDESECYKKDSIIPWR